MPLLGLPGRLVPTSAFYFDHMLPRTRGHAKSMPRGPARGPGGTNVSLPTPQDPSSTANKELIPGPFSTLGSTINHATSPPPCCWPLPETLAPRLNLAPFGSGPLGPPLMQHALGESLAPYRLGQTARPWAVWPSLPHPWKWPPGLLWLHLARGHNIGGRVMST